jgi:imidazolonepropionase-like amidohydrolase
MRRWMLFVVAPLLASVQPIRSESASARDYAFVDVNVVPMDREVVLRHRTVLVSSGRIVRIEPSRRFRVRPNVRVIAGRGRYLLPGLADMHQHFLRSPVPGRKADLVFADADEKNRLFGLLAVANGVTTVRSLWGQPAIDRVTARFVSGASIGPTVYSSGPITDGDPPEILGARAVGTPELGRAAVREDKQAHRDGIKIYDKISVPVYDAIIDEARRQHLPVWGHLPFAVSLDHAIASRQNSIEHVDSLLAALQADPSDADRLTGRQLVQNADPERLRPYARRMKAAGVWVCPTIAVYQMDWPQERSAAGMTYFSGAFMRRYAGNWASASTAGMGDDELRLAIATVRVLHEEGVEILAGSDALKRNVVPGFGLLQELRYLVQAGFTPFQALEAATTGPARFLGRSDAFGSVATGKRADLLLLNANPLMDIANLERRAGVMVSGRWYTEADLQLRLARARRRSASK